MCVTFRVQVDEEQVITSTYSANDPNIPFYEISTTSTEIKIHGLDDMGHPFSASIHHDTREWTTLFVEWMPCGETKERCNFMINNDSSTWGSFQDITPTTELFDLSLGARFDDTKHLTGSISALEIYGKFPCTDPIPPSLRHLIISNQMVTF